VWPMARIFDEKFEGAGSEETWAETVTSPATLDDDALSSDVSAPSGWGAQCMKNVSTSTSPEATPPYIHHAPSTPFAGTIYFRFELVLTAESFSDGDFNRLITGWEDGFGPPAFAMSIIQRAGPVLKLRYGINNDGVGLDFLDGPTMTLNTRHRVEIKWDTTNNLWAVRLDGSAVDDGSLSSSHAVDVGELRVGAGMSTESSSEEACTVYHDLIAVDNADWVGAELVAVSYGMAGGIQELNGGMN